MALSEIDRSLLQRCLARKPRAWEDFVDRFMGLVVTWSATRPMPFAPAELRGPRIWWPRFFTLVKDDLAVLRHFRGEVAWPLPDGHRPLLWSPFASQTRLHADNHSDTTRWPWPAPKPAAVSNREEVADGQSRHGQPHRADVSSRRRQEISSPWACLRIASAHAEPRPSMRLSAEKKPAGKFAVAVARTGAEPFASCHG